MRYWTFAAEDMYNRFATTIHNQEWDEAVHKMVQEQIQEAIALSSPEMMCALMKFTDDFSDDPPGFRFYTGIRCMSNKNYDLAYACWDDNGAAFITTKDHARYLQGSSIACPSKVIRDLCGNILDLQKKLSVQTQSSVDTELSDLLGRIL